MTPTTSAGSTGAEFGDGEASIGIAGPRASNIFYGSSVTAVASRTASVSHEGIEE